MLRLEHNGDEAREILGAGSEQLKKLKYYLKNYPVDALLLSAGGNDLVSRRARQGAQQEGHGRHLAERHQARRANYRARRHRRVVYAPARCARRAAAQVRGGGAQLLLLPAHRPQGHRARSACCKAGPWMRPVLVAKGIDPDTEGRDARAVPRRRAACAAEGARGGARRAFSVVDMRAALPVDDVHWADEIHPSGTGFRRLAEDLLAAGAQGAVSRPGIRLMHDEQLRPVLDRLLATRRAKVEDTQSGARKGLRVLFTGPFGQEQAAGGAVVRARAVGRPVPDRSQPHRQQVRRRHGEESRRAVQGRRGVGCGADVRRHGSPVRQRRIVHRRFGTLPESQRRAAAAAHRELRRRACC